MKIDWAEVDRLWGEILPVLTERLRGNWKMRADGSIEPSERPALEEVVDARRHHLESFWCYLAYCNIRIELSYEVRVSATSNLDLKGKT